MSKGALRQESGTDRFGNACTTSISIDDDGDYGTLIRIQDYKDCSQILKLDNDDDDQSLCFIDRIRKKLESIEETLAAVSSNISLYTRHWKPSGSDERSKHSNEFTFTVASFNILARGLSSGRNSIFLTPFAAEEGHDGNYGGFTHLIRPDIALDYDHRKWRLLSILLGGGIVHDESTTQKLVGNISGYNHQRMQDLDAPFDILAMQEVDDYHAFWHPLLVCNQNENNDIKKYQGIFQPKPMSPCVNFGWYSDGVALFWNVKKFQTIAGPHNVNRHESSFAAGDASDYWMDKGSFRGDADSKDISVHHPARAAAKNQVYIIVPLQCIDTDQIVVFATTHLKAKKGYMNECIRHLQALELKHRVNQMSDNLRNIGWENIHVVIMGDFNSEPYDSSVQCMMSNVNGLCGHMKSVYNLEDNELFTTWKARKDGSICRTIDYIFYSSISQSRNNNVEEPSTQLHCKEILAVPEKEEIDELLPGFRYPSDHLLVASKFQFTSS